MNQGHRFLVGALGVVVLVAALVLIVVEGQGAMAADTIIFVDAEASGENNGTSWGNAYTELQPALEAAVDGDEIWVAKGRYTPAWQFDAGDPRSATFQLKNGVAIYGGFDPSVGDIAWEDRDWEVNPTILSGDLNGDDGPDFANNAENSYHVFYHPDGTALDATAILDGFTITGGNAESSVPHNQGAGMYNYNRSSPTLIHCTFAGNSASFDGGGMFNIGDSSPSLTNCTFQDNSAAYEGGGMFNSGSSPSLTDCTFQDNSATSEGGGMYNGYYSSPSLINCLFAENSSGSGGGIYNAWFSSPSLTNCTFSGGSAVYNGGGMYNWNGSSPMLTNCVLWGDSPQEIFNYDEASSPVIAYSDIQGGCDANPFNDCGMGNINADPLFLDAGAGDLRLQDTSPAIDAGDNDAPGLVGVTTDRAGNPRFADIIGVPDTGNGNPPIVDMGAYETLLGVVFVDRDALGANDGSSWDDAFTDVQLALEAVEPGHQIWVAEGTYKPTSGDDRNASFQMKNGVAMYGGFDPSVGAITFGDRDWVLHETILSGDLNGDDGPDFENNDENSYHVFYHPSALALGSTAVLDGFTISGGNSPDHGGGMFNSYSSPTLTSCTFTSNSAAHYGGGMDNASSSPTLTDCTFTSNLAGGYGGGMRNDSSSPALANCTFSGNSGGSYGGGMFNEYSSPTLTDCTFTGNSAGGYGGGMYNASSSPTLTSCTFSGNSVYGGGGGMRNDSSSPALANCIFEGNSAGHDGGGMYNWDSSPVLTNCTFSGNSAAYSGGGGMYNHEYSSPALTNCILWGDTSPEIRNVSDSSPVVTYSDVQGGCDTIPANDCGTGNINADPLFVDPANGDFHLKPDSPCIDAGNNAAPTLPEFDFEGDERILDGDCYGTAIVDMGVDEGAFAWTCFRIYLPVVLKGY